MAPTVIVLLAYGSDTEYKRTIFCLKTFWAWFAGNPLDVKTIIYTDLPDYFPEYLSGLDVEYYSLTANRLSDMLGNTDYIHRRKVCVVKLTFEQYADADILFLDSDTFFHGQSSTLLKLIKPGFSIMHKKEFTLEEGLKLFTSFGKEKEPLDFTDLVENTSFTIGHETVSFNRNSLCWNSGVLGMTNNLKEVIADTLYLTDSFYINSRWFISEQWAFSLVLEHQTTILASDAYVTHYWGKRQKRLMDKLISTSGCLKNHADYGSAYFRKLSLQWKKQVINDVMKEEVLVALRSKNWSYALKATVKAVLKSPFNIQLFGELYRNEKTTY
jgi:hypothetical protein